MNSSPHICRRLRAAIPIMIAALLTPQIAAAQYQTRTWLDWRTIETPRFSFHYPTELEAWARSVASRMEGVDSAVSRVVGFSPPRRIQVVIDDPYRISNGSSWPFLDKPALVFWATPPSPREDLGTYLSWADMLATHEFAHLAHLTRPSRNSAVAALWNLLPVELGPIGRKIPRWMIEGYATYVEGVITQSGRPNGNWRPAILRQWAIEGTLPTYPQLSGMGGMYGGDFAYLGGSAFIEWLVARRGESSLTDLWRRLTAKNNRGFDAAFTGVYGEPPAILYGRFIADLTEKSTDIRRRVAAAVPDSGRVIQHLAWETGDPAISTDGGKVALLVASATKPARVVIWSTLAEPDTAAERARKELLAKDPDDVPPIRVFPPAKKALATLTAVGNQPYQSPRFFRDGRLLVWRNAAVGDGSYAPDLFIWDPQRKTVKRVTRAANIRQGDPSPDGLIAAALRCADGHCDLVAIDVRTGAVRTIAEGRDTRSFYRPRFSPDGRSILASVHDAGYWQLATISVSDGSLTFLTSGNANFYDASFADDSTIVTTTDLDGIPTVVRMHPGKGHPFPIALVTGAAVGAEVNPADQSVWFLALHARGWDLRSAPLNSSAALPAPLDPSLSPAGPAHSVPRSLPTTSVGASRSYGLGPRKWIYFPGTAWSDEGASLTLAVVNTDIVGRHELLFQWQGGLDNSWQGTSLGLTSRATRVPWTASGFMVRQHAGALTSVLHGGALSVEVARRIETSSRRLNLGGTISDLETTAGPDGLRALGYASTSIGFTRYANDIRRSLQLSLSGTAGRSAGVAVRRATTTATVEEGSRNPISITGTLGMAATESRVEQFTIGGLTPVILHPGVLAQRIAMPVLPTAYATGKKLAMYRATLSLGALRGYEWRGRVWSDTVTRWERVVGLEWVGSIPQIAAIGTPAARLTAGVGTWSNAPRIEAPLFVNGTSYYARRRSRTRFYVMTQFGDWAR